MTDATVLVPTHRHAELLPYALESALEQRGVAVEIFVVGDGVGDETRGALEPFAEDARLRFFDFPKGERHGEAYRHTALSEASGTIVCYLSDDDLLLQDHVAAMAELLGAADFAHSAPFFVEPDGSLSYAPIDIARPEFRTRLLDGWNVIGLTGAAHTLDAYRRLPHGWRPAPPAIWTDLYMWQQFLRLPGFRGRTASRLTHLHFPDSQRRGVPVADRVAELERWSRRIQQPHFAAELTAATAELARLAAVNREAHVHELSATVAAIQATRWWQLRVALATSWPLRTLLARRRGAR